MMQNLKKYELNYKQALNFVEKSINETNQLSNVFFNYLQRASGRFFTVLPDGIPTEKVHEFEFGGKTKCLRVETAKIIKKTLNSNSRLSCVFDDFNADFKNSESNDLYQSNGLHYNDEIYYSITKTANQKLILKCLRYSNATWHSLCVITEFSLDKCENRILSIGEITMICENSFLFIIGAYDAEGYIFWEKTSS